MVPCPLRRVNPFQLLFSPGPKLPRQFVAHRIINRIALHPHRHVVLPTLHVLGNARPQLILCADLDRGEKPVPQRLQQPQDERPTRRAVHEIRLHHARMDGRHLEPRVRPRELPREHDVGSLALAVARVGAVLAPVRLEGVEVDPARGAPPMPLRGEDHDPDVAVGGPGCCPVQERQQELGQERVADVVGSELDLVALLRLARRGGHDAGVEHEDVQTVGFRADGGGGLFDRVKRGEV